MNVCGHCRQGAALDAAGNTSLGTGQPVPELQHRPPGQQVQLQQLAG
jgi:hypothetical protein